MFDAVETFKQYTADTKRAKALGRDVLLAMTQKVNTAIALLTWHSMEKKAT